MKIRKASKRAVSGLLAGTFTALLAFSSLAPATAAPGDEALARLEQARQNEAEAAQSVEQIEKSLAEITTSFQAVDMEARAAEYAYADAYSNFLVLKQQAEKAQQDALEASEKVELARRELGHLARVLYTSQGSLSSIKPYISRDGLATAEMQNVARELFGARADAKMHNFENILKVQRAIEERAKQAEQQQAEATKQLELQKDATAQKKAEAEKQKRAVEARRVMLLNKLSQARNITAEAAAEWQREQERRAEEARKAAIARAAAEAARQAAAWQKQNSGWNGNQTPARPASNAKGAELGQQLANYAHKFLGIPYVWGGTNPKVGLDCSGLMLNVYGAFGINLPRIAAQQRFAGPHVTDPRPGDMVNWGYHVGIYIGNGLMIHAPQPGMKVEISPLWGNPVFVRVT